MIILRDHHHYKKDIIPINDRAAVYERYVADLLFLSKLPDSERDSSAIFEMKHHHSVAQFIRILAKQRGLQEDICVVGALLHDIYVVINGSYKDHAHKSAEIAQELLNEVGLFSDKEKMQIVKIVYHHSDKDIWSKDPYEEIGKDADILDSFLYPNAFGYYLKYKRLSVFKHYIERAKRIWNEVNIPLPLEFSVLDNYSEGWLNKTSSVNIDIAIKQLAFLLKMTEEERDLCVPTFCISQNISECNIHFNEESLKNFTLKIRTRFYLQATSYLFEIPPSIILETRYMDLAIAMLRESYGNLLIIWSVLCSYEVIDAITNAVRVSDLGINI